jgi:hypothetical protein
LQNAALNVRTPVRRRRVDESTVALDIAIVGHLLWVILLFVSYGRLQRSQSQSVQ